MSARLGNNINDQKKQDDKKPTEIGNHGLLIYKNYICCFKFIWKIWIKFQLQKCFIITNDKIEDTIFEKEVKQLIAKKKK